MSLSFRPQPAGGALLLSMLATAVLPPAAADARDIVVNGQRPPEANPNADPAAPYKVDRSANGRFTEPLRDTPKSITAIPKEVIADMGANALRDLVRTQPGVTLGTGEGGNAYGDRVFIRGFEARNDVYIDGMRDPGVVSRELFAVEQVEIVKGPSSAFAGRGTTGGALSLMSKQPAAQDFLVAEATGGLPDLQRATVDVNRRLGETLTVRAGGLYHREDVAGRDVVHQRRWGGVGSVRWAPDPRLSLAVDYYHLTVDGVPDYGVPFDARSQEPFKVRRSNFYGVKARDFIANRADIVTGLATWRPIDAITFTSRTRYGRTRNSYIASAPENPVITAANPNLWTVRANPKNRNAINDYVANQSEAKLELGDGFLRQTIVLGGEFSRETVTNRPYAFDSEVIGTVIVPPVTVVQNLLHPNPAVAFPFPRILAGTRTVTRVDSIAGYALDTIKAGEHWQLLLGLRQDEYKLTYVSTDVRNLATRLQNDVAFLNWQGSLVYKPVKPLSLYASISSSSNPSGEQLDGGGAAYNGIAVTTQDLEPERNKAYEAGAKWEPGHLLLTAAVFRVDKTNARTQIAPNVFALAGALRLDGFEFGVAGNITPRWAVFGGYTYLDSRVRRSGVATQVGSRFPNVPKHSASLLSTYAVTGGLTLGGQLTYNSQKFGGTDAVTTARIPGWWRWDAVARLRISNHLQARLNVLNLTNKVYYDAIYRSATPFAYIAPGRSATLGLTASF